MEALELDQELINLVREIESREIDDLDILLESAKHFYPCRIFSKERLDRINSRLLRSKK